MKVMLLAAGRGERMGELTANCPKPLLKVSGRPLIEHHIERLAAAGFSYVVINVCYLASQIMAYLGDGSRWGITIHYPPVTECRKTGGGVVTVSYTHLTLPTKKTVYGTTVQALCHTRK